MKLVLHIGTEKTGTTLLQNWLYANQQALSDQGVFLSDQLGKPNNRKIVAYFMRHLDDFARQRKITNLAQKEIYFEGFEAKFRAEIAQARARHHTMVISSEHFHSRLSSLAEIETLAAFLTEEFDEVKVLCYFREQSSMRESLYSTGLKTATTTLLEEFDAEEDARRYYYNFDRIATNWSEAFGVSHCDFRIYDRAGFPEGDIRLDMLSAFFTPLDPTKMSFERVSSNESLSLLQGRMLLAINRIAPYWAEGGGLNPVNRLFKSLVMRCTKLGHGRLGRGGDQAFAARFADSNRRFFETFLSSYKGFSVAAPQSQPDETLPLDTVADLVEEVVDVFVRGTGDRILTDMDADVLRDVALNYERGQPPSHAEALALMRLARRARPRGAVIQKKIRDWENGS